MSRSRDRHAAWQAQVAAARGNSGEARIEQSLFIGSKGSGNQLLDALAPDDRFDLARDVTAVRVKAHEATHSVGTTMRFVDFPIDAVLSVVVTLKNGDTVEVGTVGRESFVETDAVLDSPLAQRTSFCQVGGMVARMAIETFEERMEQSPAFATAMRRNARASLFSAQQYAACNIRHTALERAARWLAMTQDRVGNAQFALSSDFLAIMLGVKSDIVAEATEKLSRAGALTYEHGVVTVLDTALLDSRTCECYGACKSAFTAALNV
jgi:CRP-like cAMP-binding protein